MAGKKSPLVTYSGGQRQVIGTAEVVDVPEGQKVDVDIENIGENVSSYTIERPNLIQE